MPAKKAPAKKAPPRVKKPVDVSLTPEQVERETRRLTQRLLKVTTGREALLDDHVRLIEDLARRVVMFTGKKRPIEDLFNQADEILIGALGDLRKLWLRYKDNVALGNALRGMAALLRMQYGALNASKEVTREAFNAWTKYYLIDRLYRTGEMSLRLGGQAVATSVAAMPIGINFTFDPLFGPTVARLRGLSIPGSSERASLLKLAADELTKTSAEYLASIIRTRLAVQPIPGSRVVAPLTNTGRLMGSIKVLREFASMRAMIKRPGPVRVASDSIVAFGIGVDPSAGASATHQAPPIYAAALNISGYTTPKLPPYQRLEAWATARGHEKQFGRRTARKIARAGVPGRLWLPRIMEGARIAPMMRHRVAHAFKQAWEVWTGQ